MPVTLLNMFFVFLKMGSILLGGGYVIVPLLQSELVEKREWITKEEMFDLYAIAQCIPGIIAANTALFIGYKLRGKTGAFIAFLGLTLPPFLAIVLLASVLVQLSKSVIMNDIFWGVNVAIIILILLTVKEVWKNSIVDRFTLILFFIMFLLTLSGISPSLIIILAAISGIVFKKLKGEEKNE